MNTSALEPRRHAPPEGWDAQTFECVTAAIASALVAAVRRADVKNPPITPESNSAHVAR
jgi:hypothetical protein